MTTSDVCDVMRLAQALAQAGREALLPVHSPAAWVSERVMHGRARQFLIPKHIWPHGHRYAHISAVDLGSGDGTCATIRWVRYKEDSAAIDRPGP